MDIVRGKWLRRNGLWAGLGIGALVVASCGGEDPVAPADPDPGPTNRAPVAQAGADQTVSATLPVSLDGSASTDADGDPITYAWSIASAPAGSAAALDDAASATPSFTPDLPGAYTVELVVNDGTVDSAADPVSITAEDNTATETIGAGGGTITSTDGRLSLEVPAGALAADEEISITLVTERQWSEELGDLGDDGMVYEMRPDGLQFAQPVRGTLTLPESHGPTPGAAEIEVTGGVLLTLSDGSWEVLGDQLIDVDAVGGATRVTGEIRHFSIIVFTTSLVIDQHSAKMRVVVRIPGSAQVGHRFAVDTQINTDPFVPDAPSVRATMTHEPGDPVRLEGTFDENMVNLPNSGVFRRDGKNEYVCSAAGTGSWAGEVTIEGLFTGIGLPTFSGAAPLRYKFSQPITCLSVISPFEPFPTTGPEGFSRVVESDGSASDSWVFSSEGGGIVTDGSGRPVAELYAPELSGMSAWGAIGIENELWIAHTPTGLFVANGQAPTSPPAEPLRFTFERFPQLALAPDMSDNITDVVLHGTPEGGLGLAAVHHETREISLFWIGAGTGGTPTPPGSSHAAGLTFREDLAGAFKPNGTSIFGTDLPVTAYLQPEGFDESAPMLVASIDPAIQSSTLWLVELSGTVATATEVQDVSLVDEVRRVRCLDGICAASAYGSAFGFGGLTFFQWDGADGFTPLVGIAGRTIGIDMMRTTGGSVLVGRTLFPNNAYEVYELSSTTGEVLSSVFDQVPQGCTGPGHLRFRSQDEVVITCQASGLVTSATFDLSVGG